MWLKPQTKQILSLVQKVADKKSRLTTKQAQVMTQAAYSNVAKKMGESFLPSSQHLGMQLSFPKIC
jgi:hypothetical protein